jgi:hypothetical protein
MNDLLISAARAAGITEFEYCELVGGCPALYVKDNSLGIWAPLTDDGDALRLAVKLGLRIEQDWFTGDGKGNWQWDDGRARVSTDYAMHLAGSFKVRAQWFKEFHQRDPYAATRLAIVRAAAAIGAGIKEIA